MSDDRLLFLLPARALSRRASTPVPEHQTRTAGGVCVDCGRGANQGLACAPWASVWVPPTTTTTTTPLTALKLASTTPDRALPTPVTATPLIVFDLRLCSAGAVTGLDTLDMVVGKMKQGVSEGVREAVVG